MSKLKAKQPEEVKPGKTKGCLFGPSGAGKTWFALSFPNPYYIDTEGGADLKHYQAKLKAAGGAYLGPQDGSNSFDTILEEMKTLATVEHPYKTLVIDSITKPFISALTQEQERLGEKDQFGASKKLPIRMMRRVLDWTARLDMNVWFIAHEVAVWGEVNGQRSEIGRGPDVYDKMVYELDLTLQVIARGSNSRIAMVHKSRLLGFPQRETFMLQDNGADVGYTQFAERYGKDYIEAPAQPITLATPEQVYEINRLLSVVKVPNDQVEKILTRANADSWSELNDSQAQATINWLLKQVSGKES